MRELSIISFNVNGLISFTKRRGYTESTFSKLIDNICVNDEVTNANLNVKSPDIICLQECKMSFGDDLNNSIGCPGNYESYFSLAENNKRYSGVATYCSKRTAVIEAARGFSWLESNPYQFDINQMIQTEELQEIEFNISKIKDRYGISISEIDREGRCVITDHKQFVLLNLYVPLLRSKAEEKEEKEKEAILIETQNQIETQAELSEAVCPERLKYRLAFQEYLNLLLHVLGNACKRNVILAGDFNIILEKIDCYDDCGILDNCKLAPYVSTNTEEISEISSFTTAYMHIRRMNIEMIKEYCLVDAYRHYYPRTSNKYTCWNQMNQSRIRNQGTRIDLFLVSKGLISESIKCEILDHIYGSDHCPILLILKTGELESSYNNEKRKPPGICSKYLPQCKQRQSTISQFLTFSKNGGQINKTIRGHDFKINNKISLNHPQCKHGIPCVKKKVTKSGINKGRLYWSCSKSDQQKCNTFSWIEETNSNCKTNHDLKNFVIR
ncbi:AP endonuclease 1 [Cryptosporidium meleagridis]